MLFGMTFGFFFSFLYILLEHSLACRSALYQSFGHRCFLLLVEEPHLLRLLICLSTPAAAAAAAVLCCGGDSCRATSQSPSNV